MPTAPSFTDVHGRTWSVVITAEVVKAARDVLGLNLSRVMQTTRGPFKLVLERPPKQSAELLWMCCAGQAAGLAIDPKQFALLLADDGSGTLRTWERAAFALLRALAAFYPTSPGGRSIPAAWAEWTKNNN